MDSCELRPDMDSGKIEDFSSKMLDMLNSAFLCLSLSTGYRTGLFETMSCLPAATSAEIADAAGLHERYVREWLGAMVTGGVIEYVATRLYIAANFRQGGHCYEPTQEDKRDSDQESEKV